MYYRLVYIAIMCYIHIMHSSSKYYFAGDCNTGDTRLVNEKGDSEADGRVEICSGGRWETVCGKYWTKNNTAVVCRHLGFNDIIGSKFKRYLESLKT